VGGDVPQLCLCWPHTLWRAPPAAELRVFLKLCRKQEPATAMHRARRQHKESRRRNTRNQYILFIVHNKNGRRQGRKHGKRKRFNLSYSPQCVSSHNMLNIKMTVADNTANSMIHILYCTDMGLGSRTCASACRASGEKYCVSSRT
jgi:hypothetical protein